MAVVIPPGKTFLDTLNRSFVNVPVDKEKNNAVSTTEFLEAAESLTTLFGTLSSIISLFSCMYSLLMLGWLADILGSMAFNPVKNDMLGNVKVLAPLPL